ncbi:MAG: hypothetical protein FWF85_01435 [Clostridiales bacterium]|jgi:PBP1b-binding outer membrane lipoprotein LpoB|nr:hypothetical protein [Clostridiales bacterium]MDR2713495.1 hypothetical protein [Clostridiales bacterium]
MKKRTRNIAILFILSLLIILLFAACSGTTAPPVQEETEPPGEIETLPVVEPEISEPESIKDINIPIIKNTTGKTIIHH